jgi:hypothetical protein
MTLEWTVEYTVDFPEEELEHICDILRQEGYSDRYAVDLIREVIMGFEDDEYYAWSTKQTQEVMNEIKRRIGGIQLSMFDDKEEQ